MAAVKRRDFVRVVGLAAATAAIGWSAARKIRVGLLRTEHPHLLGKLRAMLDSPEDYEVVAACEPDATTRKLRQSDELFRGLRWVSQDELLGDSSIDLVVVECYACEPEHLRYGRAAIAANKHLHLEKPAGNELAPFRELVDEARHKGLLFQMGYVWRFHPAIDAALEAARKGWLGDVQMVRTTMNTDLEPYEWDLVGRYRGGMMYELGGHAIDRVIDLLGRPQRVQSWLRHDTSIHDKLADNTLAVFEYDRALAVVTTAAHMEGGGKHRSFEVIGTDGTFLIQPVEPAAARVIVREDRGPYKKGWHNLQLPQRSRYIGDFKDLARAIKSKQPLKYSYDHELLLQETLLRASGEIA